MPKDTFYFSHDYNARNDEKIKRLIRKHGMQGYGVFWSIVEELYNNANALQLDYDGIAFDLRTESDIVKSVINDFQLFNLSGDYFSSQSVENRITERMDKSQKARNSAYSRWNKEKDKDKKNANALQTESEGNAIKERKGKERKESNIPSESDFMSFCLIETSSAGLPWTMYEYPIKAKYEAWVANGWKDGHNKPIKNWKSKVKNTLPFLAPLKNGGSNQNGNKYQNQVEAARKAFKPLES